MKQRMSNSGFVDGMFTAVNFLVEVAWETYRHNWESTNALIFTDYSIDLLSKLSKAFNTLVWIFMTENRKYNMNMSFPER